jgi:hypothetical protein
MEQDVAPAEAADAAAAFEALRREVALLNVAVAGLAADRAPAPDYSETLGEIAKGVSVAVGWLGKVLASPALALGPAEIAQRIAAAGDEARRLDHVAFDQARNGLERVTREISGLVDGARLAGLQQRRLFQVALAGAFVGALLGVLLPGAVARLAPARWAWPEVLAARVLRRDTWSAGERMLAVSDTARWQALKTCRSDVAADQSRAVASPRPRSKR